MTMRWALLAGLCGAILATEPNEATRRWWSHVQALAGDDLAGRDTGSEGYRKAAAYVARQFEAAGLKPAGENNGWYQSVPLHAVRLRTDLSEAALVRADGSSQKLQWLRQITIPARIGGPAEIDAPLVFEGQEPASDPEGKVLARIGRGGAAGGRGGS